MQFQSINKTKGILYAAVSSSTFGLAPFFSVMLLNIGFSSFEVLSYRWGIASLTLILFGWLSGCNFRLNKKDFGTVFPLSLFRAATSLSLLIAYQNIASGVASIIHFMYPLAVAMSMILFFHEKRSAWIITAISMSIVGAILLSSGNIGHGNGNTTLGIISACISVFSYGGYIIGVRKSRAVQIESTVLTCYVMGLGALLFIICGCFTSGIRLVTEGVTWLYILGLALPATAISNITLVKAIKHIGPTLTSIFGAMEPLTAVIIGIVAFKESFTVASAIGIMLIVTAVTIVVCKKNNVPINNVPIGQCANMPIKECINVLM